MGPDMATQTSLPGKLWDWLKSLAAVAIIGGMAWYGYSLWDPEPPSVNESVPGASFNCRKALADLATDYTCMNSDSCTMTSDEQAEVKRLEANINKYCD